MVSCQEIPIHLTHLSVNAITATFCDQFPLFCSGSFQVLLVQTCVFYQLIHILCNRGVLWISFRVYVPKVAG